MLFFFFLQWSKPFFPEWVCLIMCMWIYKYINLHKHTHTYIYTYIQNKIRNTFFFSSVSVLHFEKVEKNSIESWYEYWTIFFAVQQFINHVLVEAKMTLFPDVSTGFFLMLQDLKNKANKSPPKHTTSSVQCQAPCCHVQYMLSPKYRCAGLQTLLSRLIQTQKWCPLCTVRSWCPSKQEWQSGTVATVALPDNLMHHWQHLFPGFPALSSLCLFPCFKSFFAHLIQKIALNFHCFGPSGSSSTTRLSRKRR